ncbi:MAG: hypothetical protein K0R50_993 [Eubacterium sp.]|nr:hypothetical protein [Eubacterium sp.]
MIMKKRVLAVLLVLGMLFQVFPRWPGANEVYAAAGYADIYIPSGGKLVNGEDLGPVSAGSSVPQGSAFPGWIMEEEDAENTTPPNFMDDSCDSFRMFSSGAQGTAWSSDDGDAPAATGIYKIDGHFYGRISVSENPVLKRLAEGGQAYFMVRVYMLDSSGDHDAAIWAYTQKSAWYNAGGDNRPGYGTTASYWTAVSKADDDDDRHYANSQWMKLDLDDVLIIETETHGADTHVDGIQLYFADIAPPAYNGNILTTDGTVRHNDQLDKNELFLKQGQYINMALNFSEPVFPTNAASASEKVGNTYSFIRTELFNNSGADGYTPSTYYLESADAGYNGFTPGSINLNDSSRSTFNMKYTAAANDSTGNTPLDPLRLTDLTASEEKPSLIQRINDADFIDGAGNPAVDITGIGTVPLGNNDYPSGTYRTIIDARPPKYSPVKNGVQPDILTQLVLNKGDTINFTVNLNEEVVSAINPADNVRLAFNNGMLASYQSGSNTDTWKFSMTVPSGTSVETALLETTALEHSAKTGDGNVIWDYAHNYLTDAVKSIAEANLSIDNTAPDFNYTYKNENGNAVAANQYVKSGNIGINAFDPDIKGQSSKGLYRAGSGSGLVYYLWSKSPADPFAVKNDNFAAVKRYSLATKQPWEDLYSSGYNDINLSVANNGSTIELPAEAAGKSENWYLHTWTADMTWDSARQLMQYQKGSAMRADYLSTHPDATPAEQETNFRMYILPFVSQYDDIVQWPVDDFKQDDSNWIHKCAELKLDNDLPVLQVKGIIDNKSDNVKTTISATDMTSDIKDHKISYQYVKKGELPDEAGWLEAILSGSGQAVIGTLENPAIENGGKYEIYAKAEDLAGNTITSNVGEIDVLVINKVFESYGDKYVINKGPDFTICGLPLDNLEYQYTYSSERPASTSWSAIGVDRRISAELKGETGYTYDIPADRSKNGTVYLHIKAKQEDMDRYYYYYKEYKFDHLPPVVTFSTNGYLYPLPKQTTLIAVEDSLVDSSGVADENIHYQWLKVEEGKEEAAPDRDSPNWVQAPSDGNLEIEVDSKSKDGNYRLYVHVKDSLGNEKIYNSGLFAVYYLSHEPPVGSAGLIYTTGNETDGYTAVLKLEVDVPSKVGYFYSVSSNGGENWSTWQPYTNFVGVPVDTVDTDKLKQAIKVKFRGYFLDNISEIYSPDINIEDSPAYALASLEKIEPVRGGAKRSDGGVNDGLIINFTHTGGKAITPTGANPEMPEILEENKAFRIYRNGNYTFNVADGSKTAVVSIVVSNFDETPPVATIKYSTIKKTSADVIVSLKSSEPIRITNLDSNKKIFEENGEFIFEFEDAVGLTGSAIALVNNIDKTPPQAEIKLHYNDEDMKALIRYNGKTIVVNSSGKGYNAAGEYVFFDYPTAENVIASNMILAEVKAKDGEEKDFKVINNNKGSNEETIVIKENGEVWFRLSDNAGNTATITAGAISAVCAAPPKVTKTILTRVDDNGSPLAEDRIVTIDGKEYSKGKVRVSFELEASPYDIPENTVMIGNKPVKDFSKDYSINRQEKLVLIDRLGNRNSQLFKIDGLDNTPPEIKLNKPMTTIMQNIADFDFTVDFGGYSVSDNLSADEDLKVEIMEEILVNGQQKEISFDLSRPGKHIVRYIVTDQLGNKGFATQQVYVRASDDMFILANDLPLSPDETETAILNTNKVTFKVYNYDIMKLGKDKTKTVNEKGTFDILYYTGLYREGQMKYVAKKLTYKQLLEGNFTVELPKAGWYTVIVRNQERERVYTTLLVSRVQ